MDGLGHSLTQACCRQFCCMGRTTMLQLTRQASSVLAPCWARLFGVLLLLCMGALHRTYGSHSCCSVLRTSTAARAVHNFSCLSPANVVNHVADLALCVVLCADPCTFLQVGLCVSGCSVDGLGRFGFPSFVCCTRGVPVPGIFERADDLVCCWRCLGAVAVGKRREGQLSAVYCCRTTQSGLMIAWSRHCPVHTFV